MFRKAKTVPQVSARSQHRSNRVLTALALPVVTFTLVAGMQGASGAHDPGVRSGAPGAGSPIAGLTTSQLNFFTAGLSTFNEIDSVTGTIGNTGRPGTEIQRGRLCAMPRPASHRGNQPIR